MQASKQNRAGRHDPHLYNWTTRCRYSLGRVVLSPLGLNNTGYDAAKFKPGRLDCTGYKNGTAQPYVSQTLLTPGVAVALRLSAEMNQTSLVADAQDVVLVRVEVVDAHGTVVPTHETEG